MANGPQLYPRDEKSFLDVSKLPSHRRKIPSSKLKMIIKDAILRAGKKSSRAILEIPDGTSNDERLQTYILKGRKLFEYYRKYYGDPATSAYDCFGKHFSEIAKEQFRNQ